MPLGQKVVIVGGGHNGLITAFYLAKGGFKPIVLESREMVGGGAVTEEFHPGFFASTLAHTLGPLRADVARDLAVEKFDCQIFQPDPRGFSPSLDGKALLFDSDVAKTAGVVGGIDGGAVIARGGGCESGGDGGVLARGTRKIHECARGSGEGGRCGDSGQRGSGTDSNKRWRGGGSGAAGRRRDCDGGGGFRS